MAFVVAVIGGTILTIPEVGAQPTVDDSASCESSTLDEAVNLIREDLKDAKLIREDLKDVKKLLQSTQQQNNASSISKKDMEDLKAACTTDTSSSISEAVSLIREDFEDVKNVLESSQQQNNETCISKKDFEDLKAAFDALSQQQNNASSAFKKDMAYLKTALDASTEQQNNASSSFKKDLEDLKAAFHESTQQQNNASSSFSETVNLIREELEYMKNLLTSIQQQLNATGISKKDLEDLKDTCVSNQ